MEKTLTVYPTAWIGIWQALVAAVPLDMFQPRIQAELEAMAEAGLVKIDCGDVIRLLQPRHSDFAKQLKMFTAKEAA